jgi:hypothetical protein
MCLGARKNTGLKTLPTAARRPRQGQESVAGDQRP